MIVTLNRALLEIQRGLAIVRRSPIFEATVDCRHEPVRVLQATDSLCAAVEDRVMNSLNTRQMEATVSQRQNIPQLQARLISLHALR